MELASNRLGCLMQLNGPQALSSPGMMPEYWMKAMQGIYCRSLRRTRALFDYLFLLAVRINLLQA